MKHPTAKACDNASVGILITRSDGRYLMFDRNTYPPGCAPSAGHVFDSHASYADAARAEVAEELGLTVISLQYLTGGWRANRCRRDPGARGIGHQWQVYHAAVSGKLDPSRRETRNVRWLDQGTIQQLAERTAEYAHGRMPDQAFAASPGIEPVWVAFLCELGLIQMCSEDLAAIDRTAAGGPPADLRAAPDQPGRRPRRQDQASRQERQER